MRQDLICIYFRGNPSLSQRWGPPMGSSIQYVGMSTRSIPYLTFIIEIYCSTMLNLETIFSEVVPLSILSFTRWYLNLVLFQFAKVFPEVLSYLAQGSSKLPGLMFLHEGCSCSERGKYDGLLIIRMMVISKLYRRFNIHSIT